MRALVYSLKRLGKGASVVGEGLFAFRKQRRGFFIVFL